MKRKTIYMDNAATSYPKPPGVIKAMADFAENIGGNPGRSGHSMSVAAGRVVYETRDGLAELIGVKDPMRIVFTMNASMSLNIAIRGLLKPGDHVITSSLEHNSVARQLRYHEENGIAFTRIPCESASSRIDISDIEAAIKPNTKSIIMMHASNVSGYILPIRKIGKLAREKGITLIVDAAQTAGALPIDVEEDNVDMLAMTGHKSLLGPQGTGALYVREGVKLEPLLHGGTGSRSEDDSQPEFMPDCLETGTPNAIGLAGLGAGIEFLKERGVEQIREHELLLSRRLLDRLKDVQGVTIHGRAGDDSEYLPVFSVSVKGLLCSEAAQIMDEEYGIMVRSGLHCAPWAHATLGTSPLGTIRISMGALTTQSDVDAVADVFTDLCKKHNPQL